MMKYKIVSDSSANVREIESSVEFASVPLTIIAGEREFKDDSVLDVQDMVNYLNDYKGKSGTACPSVADWLEAFGDAECIFCVTITSALSGSYNAARLAKEDYEAMYPERHVYIVDSLSAGPEIRILIEKLQELIEQGKDFEVISKEISEYKKHTGLMFSLESLKNLANNGRVSPVVAKVAGVLGIRVVGRASDKGELESLDKCRGEKKALHKVIARMKEMGYAKGKVRIDHCNNFSAAEQLKKLILEKHPSVDIKIGQTYGLCSFYAEAGGLIVGFEKN